MRRLTHVNICRVFDIARDQSGEQDILFLTMELLRGPTVAHRLKTAVRLPLAEVGPLVEPLVSALRRRTGTGLSIATSSRATSCWFRSRAFVRPVITDFGIAKSSCVAEYHDGAFVDEGGRGRNARLHGARAVAWARGDGRNRLLLTGPCPL